MDIVPQPGAEAPTPPKGSSGHGPADAPHPTAGDPAGSEPNPLLAAALGYADRGWPVFPLYEAGPDGRCACRKPDCDRAGKHPRTRHGLKDATTDPAVVRGWWDDWPAANVGCVTGPASGFWVVGPDGPEGKADLARMAEEHGPLPPTAAARSGSGGEHLYFRWPADGRPIPNRKNHRGTRIDVRACGTGPGYVVAPPSRNANGVYEWAVDADPAEAPGWLVAWARAVTMKVPPPKPRPGAAERAVRYTAKCPAAVSGEDGHGQLFRVARALCWGFDLPEDVALDLLRTHYNPRCQPEWSEAELAHKVSDAKTKDYGKPRGYLLGASPAEEPGPGTGPASEGDRPDDAAGGVEDDHPPPGRGRGKAGRGKGRGKKAARDKPKADHGAAVLNDPAALDELARLKVEDPAGFAAALAEYRGRRGSVRELNKALDDRVRKLRAARPASATAGGEGPVYDMADGRTYRLKATDDGGTESVVLADFEARIVRHDRRDDGFETAGVFTVEGVNAAGLALHPAAVPCGEFARMEWVPAHWGNAAVLHAGPGVRDHFRTAVQLCSGEVPTRVVYAHTGWRELAGGWAYLHAGGAVGATGPVAGVAVALPPPLAGYALPDPPTGDALRAAVRASLGLARVAPPGVAWPVLAAVYRAALGPADFAVHLAGRTGVFKSELAALAQQHFGPGLDARHLPGSWASTGNALEAVMAAAKDAVFVIDDFNPTGAADPAKLHQTADRLFRGAGNAAGRGRMRADLTLAPSRPPRCLTVSTGEDLPRGHSARARVWLVLVETGAVQVALLTACQSDAQSGHYAASLSGFVRWLALQYAGVRAGLAVERDALAAGVGAAAHARTPRTAADLLLGVEYLARYAEAVGVVGRGEADDIRGRGRDGIVWSAAGQARHLAEADPVAQFFRLLPMVLAGSRGHLAGLDGGAPDGPQQLGWAAEGPGVRPRGDRLGWADRDFVYLIPATVYAAVARLAADNNEPLTMSPQTLWSRMKEGDRLARADGRGDRNTVRVTPAGGERAEVVCIRRCDLHPPADDRPDRPTAPPGGS